MPIKRILEKAAQNWARSSVRHRSSRIFRSDGRRYPTSKNETIRVMKISIAKDRMVVFIFGLLWLLFHFAKNFLNVDESQAFEFDHRRGEAVNRIEEGLQRPQAFH